MQNKIAVIFVHGLMTKKNNNSLARMENYFPRLIFDTFQFNYRWLFILGAIRKNDDLAVRLAKMINEKNKEYRKVVVIGHSNGCALINMASEKVDNIDIAVYLHGAAPRDEYPQKTGMLYAFWTKKDLIISLLHRKILFPFKWFRERTGWGDIGIRGYEGKKPHRNFEVNAGGLNMLEAHMAVFLRQNKIEEMYKMILEDLKSVPSSIEITQPITRL